MATDRSLRNGMTVFFFFFFFFLSHFIISVPSTRLILHKICRVKDGWRCLARWTIWSLHLVAGNAALLAFASLAIVPIIHGTKPWHTSCEANASQDIMRYAPLEPKWLRTARYVTA
uniref:Uncharacterized protein n=1 Tax=Prorocentrum micans TaxID=2945 RepID=A0A7S2TDU7_PROMC|mmetsp:Transcript_81/g.77  ORF Transcript_81/g.77 Transcript_81/m.77 type:complete len:116 (+) Transcript_81:273-620(+)